jgi:hypothetical protein
MRQQANLMVVVQAVEILQPVALPCVVRAWGLRGSARWAKVRAAEEGGRGRGGARGEGEGEGFRAGPLTCRARSALGEAFTFQVCVQ